MLPIQSIEAPPPPGNTTAEENPNPVSVSTNGGEARQQKPKALPCKYCSKKFRRVEHVQRHERTHTKEKPFACQWPRCGKTFGRRDLLVRHEKLVHLNEGNNKDGSKQRKPSTAGLMPGPVESRPDTEMMSVQHQPQPQPQPQPQHHQLPPQHQLRPPMHHQQYRPEVMQPLPSAPRQPACNLDLLSDAATHLASAGELHNMQSTMMQGLTGPATDFAPVKAYHQESLGYGSERPREQDPGVMAPSYAQHPPPPPMDDYNLFLDDYATSSHFLPPSLEADQGFGMWSRPGAGDLGRGLSKPGSAFPSRFPSLQPDSKDANDSGIRHEDGTRGPIWRVSSMDHAVIKSRLDEFASVLPHDFVFPSRHTLSRFLEGYVSGFHDHLPFLHLPTLVPTELSSELLLAILAVGAQYRFETNRSHALWYAAKAVALEQIRRRNSHEVHAILPTPAAYSPYSTRPSPSAGFRHSFPSMHHDRSMAQDHREPYSPNTPQARLETIQALLLLFAIGLWGAKAILHEALSLQSLLALLVREEGLTADQHHQTTDWETWVRLESGTRTKLVAYCFFNLCSIAYNTPPLLLTSEIHLNLPCPSRLWKAESAWQWQEARQSCSDNLEVPFQEAFTRLLTRPSQGPPAPPSSLGNYVLVHALIQHIFLLKQTSLTSLAPFETHRGLKVEDVESINQALHAWSLGFEQHRQARANEVASSRGDNNSAEYTEGPVAFNSTALLRLAYIRLHTDLSTSRSLETRDHVLIAQAFNDAPLLVRSSRLCRAVVQAIHALSMLVKLGVNYVAKTKSLEWSMQHSLCNLECAVLLSKWLLTLAAVGPADQPPTAEEKSLLEMVRRMLDETEFAVPIDPTLNNANHAPQNQGHHHQQSTASSSSTSTSSSGSSNSSSSTNKNTANTPATSGTANVNATTDPIKLRQLACAVIRLWAETFKGDHIFEIIRIIAAGLEGYADLMEKGVREREQQQQQQHRGAGASLGARERTPLGGGAGVGRWGA